MWGVWRVEHHMGVTSDHHPMCTPGHCTMHPSTTSTRVSPTSGNRHTPNRCTEPCLGGAILNRLFPQALRRRDFREKSDFPDLSLYGTKK
jgi:hypothetical protein